MLGIGKLGVGQVDYYVDAVAKGVEDYYTGAGEAPGEWMGRAAARLGLTGEVAAQDLRTILGGEDPVTGARLAGRPGHERVPGWDLTFSAPKSVSVLYALGDGAIAGAVVDAHRAAVAAGLSYLEEHATVSRRRAGGVIEEVRGEGLVVGAFRHRTSRAGDPHLHTHALAANAVERVDGGWGAMHSPHLYRHARSAGFAYQSVLRAELTERLGVQWGRVENGYAEIDGIDAQLLEQFSKRRAEIEAALAERGEDSAAAAQVAVFDTRGAKGAAVDEPTLRDRWAAEAAGAGFRPGDLDAVMGHRAPEGTARQVNKMLDDIIETMVSPRGLTATQASFERRDITRAWCQELPPGAKVDLATLEVLTDLVLQDSRVVAVHDSSTALVARQLVTAVDGTTTTALAVNRRWSTTEMLATEERLLAHAQATVGAGRGQVEQGIVDAHLEARADLSEEQAAMVAQLTSSGNGVDVVVGRAGTGKTYALAAAAAVWRAGGYRPQGVALAARAGAELVEAAGIPSTTVAQFLIDCDQSAWAPLTDRDVVVVDEAAMVDTRRLARLMAHAAGGGAKVVLVGDHHQLPAVEAGGAFAGLLDRVGAVELTENRRQEQQWEQAALARLRDGAGGRPGIDDVVAEYDAQGRLHLGQSPGDVRTAMVADWYDATRAGATTAMVALGQGDVDDLNTRARARLVADGLVADTGVTVGGRTFAAGDRVVCRDNNRRLGVHNGLFARIETANSSGVDAVNEATGERIAIPVSYLYDGHLDHAYATTIHKAQGATYDRTLFLGDDRLYRQAGYTALSRGRARNDLYLVVVDDDRDRDVELDQHGTVADDAPAVRLARSLGRDGAKTLATNEAAATRAAVVRAPLGELWAEHDGLAHTPVPMRRRGDPRPVEAHQRRRRLEQLTRSIDQRTAQAGRAAEIERPEHVVALIGPPPVDDAGRQQWRDAAGAVESYQARWGSSPVLDTDMAGAEQVAHRDAALRALAPLRSPEPATVPSAALELG